MGSVVLVAEESVPAPPEEVFTLFGTGIGTGLIAGSACDRLAPGAVVSLPLPLGGTTVEVLGRISAVTPSRRVVVTHDQPWRGRLRIKLAENAPSGTRVTLAAEVGEEGLDWLMRRRGWPAPVPRDDGRHRIGLLTSKSGPGAVFAVACENLASLAIDEVNADGGLHGRPAQLLVADDATQPAIGVSEARRLIDAGCRVLVASTTSATFTAVQQALEQLGVPLVQPMVNEGGSGPAHVFRLGERPYEQLRIAAGPLMRETGARNWYLIGNDYSWSHGAHSAARRALGATRGTIAGEQYIPLGTKDFSPAIENIMRSGADLVLSSLVGADEVAFERQSQAAGLRARCRTLALALEEATRERIGDGAARGIWSAFGYFEQLSTGANESLRTRYREKFGQWAPPISTLSESVYGAVQLYAAAVRAAPAGERDDVVREMCSMRAILPRGEVALAGPNRLRQSLHLAEAVDGGFRLLGSTSGAYKVG